MPSDVCSREFRRADRGDVPKESGEVFFRKVKFWKGDAPPVFVSISPLFRACSVVLPPCLCLSQLVDGVSYLHVKKNGLHFAFTTKFNVSPCLSLELLDRITKVFKVWVSTASVLLRPFS